MGNSLKGVTTRIGNRTRRETINCICIIWRGLFDIRLQDCAVRRAAFSSKETIEDRRIRLQAHALVQPVDEYGGNTRALISLAGLFLDNRSERDKLFNGF